MVKRKLIVNKLGKVDDLPTFPEVAMKLKNKLREPKINIKEIALIIENDPALSSRILKLANSAFYGFGRQFGNVRQAVVRLGLKEVEKLTVAMGAMKVFSPKGLPRNYFKDFWTHSIMVALTTREIIAAARAISEKNIDINNAYTAGLFHAIGRLILHQYFPEYFMDILALSKTEDMELHKLEESQIGINHAEIGAIILDRWKLPDYICDSVMYQYEPDRCKKATRIYAQAVHLSHFSVSLNGNPLPAGSLPKGFSQGAWHDLQMAEDVNDLINRVRDSEERAAIMVSLGIK